MRTALQARKSFSVQAKCILLHTAVDVIVGSKLTPLSRSSLWCSPDPRDQIVEIRCKKNLQHRFPSVTI